MGKLTLRDAITKGLSEALDSNDKCYLLGEDIGEYGGAYAVPSSFLIGKDGSIIWSYPGAILKNYDPQTFADLVYKIEKELKVE